MWKLPETGITKAWPVRKEFRSAGLSICFGCSKKFHKKTIPFSPPKNTRYHRYYVGATYSLKDLPILPN